MSFAIVSHSQFPGLTRRDKNKSPSTRDDYEKLTTPTNLVRLLPSSSSFEVAPFLYTVDLRMRSTLIFNYLNLNHFKTFFYTYIFTDDTIIIQELIIIILPLYRSSIITRQQLIKQSSLLNIILQYSPYTIVIQYYNSCTESINCNVIIKKLIL